jgi:hypothetical protein
MDSVDDTNTSDTDTFSIIPSDFSSSDESTTDKPTSSLWDDISKKDFSFSFVDESVKDEPSTDAPLYYTMKQLHDNKWNKGDYRELTDPDTPGEKYYVLRRNVPGFEYTEEDYKHMLLYNIDPTHYKKKMGGVFGEKVIYMYEDPTKVTVSTPPTPVVKDLVEFFEKTPSPTQTPASRKSDDSEDEEEEEKEAVQIYFFDKMAERVETYTDTINVEISTLLKQSTMKINEAVA